jgi:ATP-dependent DNA ligase
MLRTALRDVPKPVFFSETLNAELDQLIAAAGATGLEGLIAKRGDSVYEAGKRTGLWSKLKFHLEQELVIGGYVPGPGGFDALLVGYYQDKKLIFCGKIRNGFTTPGSKETVFKEFKGLAQDTCPFDNLPEPKSARRGMALTAEAMKNCCWLKPKLVAQVGIREWTIDGHLRHSAFLGLRADQVPDKVVRDRW